jgi:hypothetical protein
MWITLTIMQVFQNNVVQHVSVIVIVIMTVSSHEESEYCEASSNTLPR